MSTNFKPGWYHATNSRKFHWFATNEKPYCNAHVKGFPEEFLKPFGNNPVQTEEKQMSVYTGGCANCIKKLSK